MATFFVYIPLRTTDSLNYTVVAFAFISVKVLLVLVVKVVCWAMIYVSLFYSSVISYAPYTFLLIALILEQRIMQNEPQ